jgi:5-(carboxyamino)imidazole ribonucleotide synthase
MGYDGKGQAIIRSEDEAEAALAGLGGGDCVLEAFVPFGREVSVIAARGLDGQVRTFDVCENQHRHHILSKTLLPAALGATASGLALDYAARIGQNLDYVGVFTVEYFVVGAGADEHVLVNEIAPRVHNSGHWTLGGAETSQFEQHIRAVAGWPLGSVKRLGRITMQNLIGDEVSRWQELLAEPGLLLELYGKREARPGRKMGHFTRVFR